ncbi:hypothetical protein FPV67DRAFT_1673460 [Lyophyllum atratum]|nr:hypothetical protein FPV67DRAFT_1673460 [Lyophyllum atratum]
MSSLHTSPAHPTADLPSTRPPTHPDRKPPFTSPHQASPFHNLSPITSPIQNVHPTSTMNFMMIRSSSIARVFRSKSLHHAPLPLPPLPGSPSCGCSGPVRLRARCLGTASRWSLTMAPRRGRGASGSGDPALAQSHEACVVLYAYAWAYT